MIDILNTFNNREKAIVVWILIFIAWALTNKKVREAIQNLLEIVFLSKVSFLFLGSLIYIILMVFLLYKIRIWDLLLVKDTLFWVVGTGFVLLVNINKATQNTSFFRKLIFDVLRLVVVLEFILNLYAFNFWIEMVLVPMLVFTGGISALAEVKPRYRQVKKLVDSTLATFGGFLIVYAVVKVASNFQSFATLYNMRKFILPPLLTLAYIPFLYFVALLMAYEILFVRLDVFMKGNKELAKFAKWRILVLCSLNLSKLNIFVETNNRNFMEIKTKNGVIDMIEKFKRRK